MRASTVPNDLLKEKNDTARFIAAIIEADKSQDWSKVQKMLEIGYSLLQADIIKDSSLVRSLASNPSTCHVIPSLLAFSKKENGVGSEAHKFIVVEATIGCLEMGDRNLLTIDTIGKYTKDLLVYYSETLKLAEMRRREIGHLVFEEGNEFGIAPIKPTPETVYHLCRGNHHEQATKHLKEIADNQSHEIVAEAIRSYLKAVSDNYRGHFEWTDAIQYLRNEILSQRNLFLINVYHLVVAEAIVTDRNNVGVGFDMLESSITDDIDDSTAELFGEIITHAARAGRTDVVLKACELARKKKLDKNERYQQLLARAAGAALVKEHFSLAKIVMLMSPKFDATERDMVELYYWPTSKIQRLSRALNDYKLFTDIVRAEEKCTDKLRWISALKNEYGLQKMSDEGFLNLLEHPEGLQKLFHDPKHKYNIADNFNDDHLSEADLKVFRDVMAVAKSEAQQPSHGKISFFRLAHLAHAAEKRTHSVETLKQSIDMKSELVAMLTKFTSGHLQLDKTKEAASKCLAALSKANTPEAVSKVIQKHLSNNPILRVKCKQIIDKFPSAAQSQTAPPKL